MLPQKETMERKELNSKVKKKCSSPTKKNGEKKNANIERQAAG